MDIWQPHRSYINIFKCFNFKTQTPSLDLVLGFSVKKKKKLKYISKPIRRLVNKVADVIMAFFNANRNLALF